jgi:RES domain-containing protein
VSLRVWRLCNQKWAATAFDGQGAKDYGGRWNPVGTAVVYTSSSLALAALETLVHLGVRKSPSAYVSIPANIPSTVAMTLLDLNDLSNDWKQDPPPLSLASIGERWARRNETAILIVPSSVIDEEVNYLLNPNHPDFAQITIGQPKPFRFDPRLRP